MLTSVKSDPITVTCTPPASTFPEASNAAAETAGWEMASNVWVSGYYCVVYVEASGSKEHRRN